MKKRNYTPKAKKSFRTKKAPSKAAIRRKALAEWSKNIRAKADGLCAICKSSKMVQAHHILPKERYPEFQFEPINGLSLCCICHKFGKLSAHRNALFFAKWLMQNRPEQYKWAIENM